MKRTLLFSLFSFFASVALGQSVGYDFKGLSLGASIAELKGKHPEFFCEKNVAGSPLADSICSLSPETKCLLEQAPYADNRSCREAIATAMTYAGVRADISLLFFNDRFGMARVVFGADSFSIVVASLREKYGEPSVKKSEPLTNRMGATFENQILEWRQPGATVLAEKYSGRIDRSSVKVFEDSYALEFEKRRAVKNQKNSKDI